MFNKVEQNLDSARQESDRGERKDQAGGIKPKSLRKNA